MYFEGFEIEYIFFHLEKMSWGNEENILAHMFFFILAFHINVTQFFQEHNKQSFSRSKLLFLSDANFRLNKFL